MKKSPSNMSPENQWLEDVFPTEIVHFRGHLLVFGDVFQKQCLQVYRLSFI